MTSETKIRANRANARASTGPQTTRGRARAARNALRHALRLPVGSIPGLSEEVETLAREIAGPGANAEIQELARRVAESQIDLRRVRYARHQFLSDTVREPSNSTPQGPDKLATILSGEAKKLLAMDRYERRRLGQPGQCADERYQSQPRPHHAWHSARRSDY
jgi:hypothetical protein